MAKSTPDTKDDHDEQFIHELSPDELAQYYDYRIQYSQEDDLFVGSVVEWPSLKAHGDTQDEALDEIKNVAEIAIEDCRKENDEVPEPFNLREFSGCFSVRIQPSLHRELSKKARTKAFPQINWSLASYPPISLEPKSRVLSAENLMTSPPTPSQVVTGTGIFLPNVVGL